MNRKSIVIRMLTCGFMLFGISVSAMKVEAGNFTISKLYYRNYILDTNSLLQISGTVTEVYEAKQEEMVEAERARIVAEEAEKEQQAQIQEATYQIPVYSNSTGSGLTRSGGVNYYNGWRETWYSSQVLYHYRTGEWTVGADGVYRDSDGYVIVSSSSEPMGTITDTSFGVGKVYDTGCAPGTHDIYTNW